MTTGTQPSDPTRPGRGRRGFTLVELMVAVTGGLVVSVVVFALARDGSRFYQRETRVADATLSTVIGFERLRNDIARAGYLSTPNLIRDPMFCGDPSSTGSWPVRLKNLSSIQILDDASAAGNSVLSAASRSPQQIILSGAYNSVERFPAADVQLASTGSGYTVTLQTNIGPLARLGYGTMDVTARSTLLTRLFPTGRALHIVNESGRFQFGRIAGVDTSSAAVIQLGQQPALNLPSGATSLCSVKGASTLVNVVNILRYRLASVLKDAESNPTGEFGDYAPLFASRADNPYEESRMELVREELDVDGAVVADSSEVVAEYAVDLAFGIEVAQLAGTTATDLQLSDFGAANVTTLAGPVLGTSQTPQLVRMVRARLSIRSREPDRDAPIGPAPTAGLPLYRVPLGEAGAGPFARVRTLQADIAIPRHAGITWP